MSALDLTNLVARIKREINRGDRYDADILPYVADAIRFLEMNNDFIYMEETIDKVLTTGFQTITLVGNVVDIEHMGWTFEHANGAGEIRDVVRVDPDQVTGIDTAAPNGYYYESHSSLESRIRFDNIADQNYLLNIRTRFYSPLAITGDEYPVENAPSLLIAGAIIQMAGLIKQPMLVAAKEKLYPSLLQTFLLADSRLRHEGKAGTMVAYSKERIRV